MAGGLRSFGVVHASASAKTRDHRIAPLYRVPRTVARRARRHRSALPPHSGRLFGDPWHTLHTDGVRISDSLRLNFHRVLYVVPVVLFTVHVCVPTVGRGESSS